MEGLAVVTVYPHVVVVTVQGRPVEVDPRALTAGERAQLAALVDKLTVAARSLARAELQRQLSELES